MLAAPWTGLATQVPLSSRPFRDARRIVRTVGATVCDVKERCRERIAMDAEKRWRERRRTGARSDVDEGLGAEVWLG